MKDLTLMTPGPTRVRENVRRARSLATTNPDLDPGFYDFYRDTCKKLSELLHTSAETYIMAGEGILGLEAACASLTEPGDQVLVISNGVFGAGFADFVEIYGGNVTMYEASDEEEIDVEALAKFLEKKHDFKYATLVHCDTPSGRLNPIHKICPLLKSYNILTVVDSVAAMFAHEIFMEDWGIDLLCGGSQKALSAPVGLTMVTVSEAAKAAMKVRKTPVASFYCNLLTFDQYYEKQWFPYTMPISDILGLAQAVDNVLADKEIYQRHEQVANYTRQTLQSHGIKLYGHSGYANSVTAFCVPEGHTAEEILDFVERDCGVMLAGSFDVYAGKLIRIGHMGENAQLNDVKVTLDSILKVLS